LGKVHSNAAAEFNAQTAVSGETFDERHLSAVDNALAAQGPSLVLLGARHDLSLREGLPPTCECVAFVAGQANDERFVWDGAKPSALPNDEVVVAFRAAVDCLNGLAAPSYQGYAVEGPNVVLLLEPTVAGRPELHGAVLPKPAAGGSLSVRSSDAKAPYAKAFSGAGECKIAVE
jgi:hypothetical protein